MEWNLFGVGIFFILGGIINVISAKNKTYLGLNWRIWTKLYGESFTRAVFFIQGIALIILGLFLIFNSFSGA